MDGGAGGGGGHGVYIGRAGQGAELLLHVVLKKVKYYIKGTSIATSSVVVTWVKKYQTELMVEIKFKSLVGAIG